MVTTVVVGAVSGMQQAGLAKIDFTEGMLNYVVTRRKIRIKRCDFSDRTTIYARW